MPEQSSFAILLAQVKASVDRALEQIWVEAGEEHGRLGGAVSAPLEAARDLCMRGGKRLRAGLVAVGYCLGSQQRDWAKALPACAAVELLQAYFLIHDDWMDQDRLRRGGPAVHAALEARFGSPHLAASGAVLAGDYTLALALRALAGGEFAAEQMRAALHCFARMQLDAVVGQQLDVLGAGQNLDQVYRLKTGSYSVFGPLELGRTLGGGLGPSSRALGAFAAPLGVAFQLRDDLIGAFAESTASGKPLGSDVLAGKRTLLLQAALERGRPEQLERIHAVLGNASAEPALLGAALSAIEATGARGVVEERIASLVQDARAALVDAGFDALSRHWLEGVLTSLVDRDH